MLISAIQQHESALSIHVSSLTCSSLPSTPISPPAAPHTQPIITEHWAKLPVLSSCFPLALCFTDGMVYMDFPDSPIGEESACNAGDPCLIPGSGRSTGEGIGYPLQYTWASLVAQLIKNPPAMRETWIQSLGWEDPLEKGKASHSSILVWRILWAV